MIRGIFPNLRFQSQPRPPRPSGKLRSWPVSEPYIGEIRMVGFNFAPSGWAFCDGSLLSISQNSALFNLIGTTYGGDGQNTFALPNLSGRIPIHQGNSFVVGESGGTEAVMLTLDELPAHSHALAAHSAEGNLPSPAQ